MCSLLSKSVLRFRADSPLSYVKCGKMVLTARRWIASVSSESFKVNDECHTGHAYSRIGLIK